MKNEINLNQDSVKSTTDLTLKTSGYSNWLSNSTTVQKIDALTRLLNIVISKNYSIRSTSSIVGLIETKLATLIKEL